MKRKQIVTWVVDLSSVSGLLLWCGLSFAAEIPGFDFNYAVSGDMALAPVQVFDDGRHVYFQFKNQTVIPAIFVRTTEGFERLAVHAEFPYVVADRLFPQLLLKLDGQQALVRYTGGRALVDGGRNTGSAPALVQNVAAHNPAPSNSDGSLSFSDNESGLRGENFHGELIFNQAAADTRTDAQVSAYVHSSVAQPQVIPSETFRDAAIPIVRKSLSGNNAAAMAVAQVAQDRLHRVRPGETLSRIAMEYSVPLKDLVVRNGLHHLNWIHVGQILWIPLPVSAVQTQPTLHPGINPDSPKNAHLSALTGQYTGDAMQAASISDAVFRIYETTEDGQIRIRQSRSQDEVMQKAERAGRIYLRGDERSIRQQSLLLVQAGVNQQKIRLVRRKSGLESVDQGKPQSDNAHARNPLQSGAQLIDVLFTGKEQP